MIDFRKFLPVLLAAFIILLVVWPLLLPGFFVSDDGEWMIIRLSAFYQSLREGQFPVRFLGRLNYSYGYPVSNFLYPGFLYIGSILKFLGFSFIQAVEFICLISISVAAAIWYRYLRVFFSSSASIFGLVVILMGPYLLFTLYDRGSVGEVLSLLPIALSFYSVERQKTIVLAFSIFMLILSHNTMAFIFIPLLLIYSNVRRRFSPSGFLFGFGMSSFFWIPALYEQRYVVFSETAISSLLPYFVSTQNITLLIPPIWILMLFVIKQKITHTAWFYIIVFIVYCFGMTSLSQWLWIEPVVRLIQFPFRLGLVVLFSGSYLAAYIYSKYRSIFIKIFIVCAICTVYALNYASTITAIQFVDRGEEYYSTNEATTTVANEYMPLWVRTKPQERPQFRAEVLRGVAQLSSEHLLPIHTQRLSYSVEANTDSVIRVNTIYYPGWGVTIDGIPTLIDYTNSKGVMDITVPAGSHILQAELRETPLRFIADMVSFASFLSIWIYIWLYRKFVYA